MHLKIVVHIGWGWSPNKVVEISNCGAPDLDFMQADPRHYHLLNNPEA
jgi:hypothetical protein